MAAPLMMMTIMVMAAAEITGSTTGEEVCETEILPNGICLPEIWPPRDAFQNASSQWMMKWPPYLENPPAAINITSGRQLFVDGFLVERSENIVRVFGSLPTESVHPVLVPTEPWETNPSSLVFPHSAYAKSFSGGIWFDEGIYKLYYMCGWGGGACFARSKDGISWEKPRLNLVKGPFTNVSGWNISIPGDSNIILLDDVKGKEKWEPYWDALMSLDGGTFWLDRHDGKISQKFKAATVCLSCSSAWYKDSFALWGSADGIHWEMLKNQSSPIEDRSTFFFNPFRRVWVFSIKNTAEPYGRHRLYFESSDFFEGPFWKGAHDGATNKSGRRQPVDWLHSDVFDPQFINGSKDFNPSACAYPGPLRLESCPAQIYNVDAVAYESITVGLFSIFQGSPETHDEYNSLFLGFSRDGFHFHRAEGRDRKPFISFNKSTLSSCHAGNPTGCVFDSYNVQSVAGGFTVIGDQLNFYFGSDRGNNANGAQGNSSVSVGVPVPQVTLSWLAIPCGCLKSKSRRVPPLQSSKTRYT